MTQRVPATYTAMSQVPHMDAPVRRPSVFEMHRTGTAPQPVGSSGSYLAAPTASSRPQSTSLSHGASPPMWEPSHPPTLPRSASVTSTLRADTSASMLPPHHAGDSGLTNSLSAAAAAAAGSKAASDELKALLHRVLERQDKLQSAVAALSTRQAELLDETEQCVNRAVEAQLKRHAEHAVAQPPHAPQPTPRNALHPPRPTVRARIGEPQPFRPFLLSDSDTEDDAPAAFAPHPAGGAFAP